MIYKLIGSFFIIAAALYSVSINLITSYFTYMYLEDVTYILQDMKQKCIMGKPYSFVFDKTYNLKYYNSNLSGSFLNKKRRNKVNEILNGAGKRNKREERDYLEYSLTLIDKEKLLYKNDYESNKKTCLITGISLGVIIVIVFI